MLAGKGIAIDESSAKTVTEQMRDILSQHAVRVIDLFREWDEDGDGTVSKKEFRKAMPLLGLEVPRKEVDALFDEWDPDGSGSLTLKELEKQLRRGGEIQLDDTLKAPALPRSRAPALPRSCPPALLPSCDPALPRSRLPALHPDVA